LRERFVGEGCRDAKALAGAADGPEEIWMGRLGDVDYVAAGEDYLRGDEIVDCEAVAAREPTVAAAESETADAGVVDGAFGTCQSPYITMAELKQTSNCSKAVFGTCNINIFPVTAAFGSDGLSFFVHGDLAHFPQINDNAILDSGAAAC
jgi:hypothetical protein